MFYEQSEGWVSATICHFIQMLLCSEQLEQLHLAALLLGFLLTPPSTPPHHHSQLVARDSEHKPNTTQPSFTLGRPGCSSPLPCLVSFTHVLSGALLGSAKGWFRGGAF